MPSACVGSLPVFTGGPVVAQRAGCMDLKLPIRPEGETRWDRSPSSWSFPVLVAGLGG